MLYSVLVVCLSLKRLAGFDEGAQMREKYKHTGGNMCVYRIE